MARECRRRGIDAAFCFAGYGNRYQEQTACLTAEDTNIKLLGFASDAELEKRLSAADIHLISLRPGWEGIVVPSKFFAALAIGRPVLFAGPEQSSIARWVETERLGAVVNRDLGNAIEFLRRLADSREELREYSMRSQQIYRSKFSKAAICKRWNEILADCGSQCTVGAGQ